MKEQSNTLKTPNIILSGTLLYYDNIESLFDEKSRHLISYPELADKLRKEVDEYKKQEKNAFHRIFLLFIDFYFCKYLLIRYFILYFKSINNN